jgi:two-component system, chemotaxis family, protein-glutamate methylesterase/glutaminase
VILNGMGDDGAQGPLEMKQARVATMIRGEASSVAFGMPAAAIRKGTADRELLLHPIPRALAVEE